MIVLILFAVILLFWDWITDKLHIKGYVGIEWALIVFMVVAVIYGLSQL